MTSWETKWAHAQYPGRGRQAYHLRDARRLYALCGVTVHRYGTNDPTGRLCRECVERAGSEAAK